MIQTSTRPRPAATENSGAGPVARHIKTHGLSLKARRSGFGNPPPDKGESRAAGSPVARLPVLSVAIFRRSGICGKAADTSASVARRLCGPARERHCLTSDTLAPVMRQIDFGLFFYHWSAMAA